MPRRYRQGGQPRNGNAVTHAGYCKFIDKRTRDGQWIKNTFLAWVFDLGGFENLSSMQLAILDDLGIIAWRCRKLGRVIVDGNGSVSENVTRDFLRFHNALVDGLSKIGLERRSRDVTTTLQEYLASRALPQVACAEGSEKEARSVDGNTFQEDNKT